MNDDEVTALTNRPSVIRGPDLLGRPPCPIPLIKPNNLGEEMDTDTHTPNVLIIRNAHDLSPTSSLSGFLRFAREQGNPQLVLERAYSWVSTAAWYAPASEAREHWDRAHELHGALMALILFPGGGR